MGKRQRATMETAGRAGRRGASGRMDGLTEGILIEPGGGERRTCATLSDTDRVADWMVVRGRYGPPSFPQWLCRFPACSGPSLALLTADQTLTIARSKSVERKKNGRWFESVVRGGAVVILGLLCRPGDCYSPSLLDALAGSSVRAASLTHKGTPLAVNTNTVLCPYLLRPLRAAVLRNSVGSTDVSPPSPRHA
jgi:hypothetical protein